MVWGYNITNDDLSSLTKEQLDMIEKMEIDPTRAMTTIRQGGGLFKSADIYTISLLSCKLMDEDQYIPTRNRLIIDKCINNLSTKDYIYGFADVGDRHFSKYFSTGKYSFIDRSPKSFINSLFVPLIS